MGDLNFVELHNVGLASILARRDATSAEIGASLSIELPVGAAWSATDAMTVIGTGPRTWVACKPDAAPDWASDLTRRLEGLASVSDQTGALRIFRSSGPKVRDLLQHGLSIDLHPDAFPPGSAAIATIAHHDVIVRCIDDAGQYECAIYRSSAESFLRWLNTTAAAL